MKEFTWQPDWKMKRKKKPNVNVIKFGDGYEQRQQNGINNNLRTYDVTFTGAEQRVSEIERFLSEHRGVHAFLWTPYGDHSRSLYLPRVGRNQRNWIFNFGNNVCRSGGINDRFCNIRHSNHLQRRG